MAFSKISWKLTVGPKKWKNCNSFFFAKWNEFQIYPTQIKIKIEFKGDTLLHGLYRAHYNGQKRPSRRMWFDLELWCPWTKFSEKITRDPKLRLLSLFFSLAYDFFRRLVEPNVNMGPYGKTGVSKFGGGYCTFNILFCHCDKDSCHWSTISQPHSTRIQIRKSK